MATTEGGYNPIGYHNGTVWPHDSALVAAGLRRYGFAEAASRVAFALLGAATHLNWRLPEVFAGYERMLTRVPVEYPTASSPQAWAAGTPLLLLRVLLAMEPEGDQLRCDPVLPLDIGRVSLSGIRGRWSEPATISSDGRL
jgi:glycogen debranching enzyme